MKKEEKTGRDEGYLLITQESGQLRISSCWTIPLRPHTPAALPPIRPCLSCYSGLYIPRLHQGFTNTVLPGLFFAEQATPMSTSKLVFSHGQAPPAPGETFKSEAFSLKALLCAPLGPLSWCRGQLSLSLPLSLEAVFPCSHLFVMLSPLKLQPCPHPA